MEKELCHMKDNSLIYYLFDKAPKKGLGSEGKKFDWKKIGDAKIEKPFFLCGGIRPDDSAFARRRTRRVRQGATP